MVDTTLTPVTIPADGVELDGDLGIPEGATGLVVFAHGSGSSRKSPRNNYVAEVIRKRGVGTLLFDLLTEREDETYETRFDIPLLVERLLAATEWIRSRDETRALKIGYFGSSTGAAAALLAAAELGEETDAVVSRGGRVDLADERLADVTAPTLFIVGGADEPVLGLNRSSYERLDCEKSLEVIPGAGHLFEDPSELEQVAELAADWFETHLA
ncbi:MULTISPECIES: dienelactone hydrolase family protein [Haloferax]|uniref:Alpha/beta hydrolase n=1 Tax=Haloferax marinum TaxID=2666143 RepID=A0A6A8GBY5_9EURY|nr:MULTISPECIES: dienelactone hydrolase family protein [Haloferax]KAB1198621.1 alpha/beta hydrolase [Haloferax sp. CBA1150]MRW97733.1 alpha/beta hydrolase [Haloferax marinum]